MTLIIRGGNSLELHSDYEAQCERYLLGELSEADSQQVEQAYFADTSLFERFVAVKEDLIDAYARGLLTGNKRKRFEKHFLGNKTRREEIEDGRRLIGVTSAAGTAQRASPAPDNQRHSVWSWLTGRSVLIPASALATLLVVALGSWILLRDRSAKVQNDNGRANQNVVANPTPVGSPGEQTATVQATPQVTPIERGTANEPPVARDNGRPIGPAPTSGLNFGGERGRSRSVRASAPEQVASRDSAEETVALVIEPRTSRSITPTPTPTPKSTPTDTRSTLGFSLSISTVGREPRLLLNANVKSVQLSLVYSYPVEGPLDVSITDMDSQEIVSVRDLRVQPGQTPNLVTLTFPASRLKRNDHIVRLSTRTKEGTSETIAEYYFTVIRKAPTGNRPSKR